VTDERNNPTNYGYDGAYRLTSVTDALNHATSYGYDAMSNLTSMTDALSRTTNYDYDDFNRLKKITYPPATTGATRLFEALAYDADGNVTSRTDTAGRVTSYTYDNLTEDVVKTDLRELEKQALAFMNGGQKRKAAELFTAIIREQPDWEHGEAFYDLAICQEDLGELDKASESYRRALEYEPSNPYFLGGYASFLYLHGDPREAFDAHLNLLEIERATNPRPNDDAIQGLIVVLRSLADKLGMTSSEIGAKLQETEPRLHSNSSC
jgi:YD repeat-containing protein